MTLPLAYGNQTTKTKASIRPVNASAIVSIVMYAVEESTSNNFKLFEYDGLNQLVKITEGSKTYVYTYNADGLRSFKTVNGVTTAHIWDGDVVQLTGTDGNVTVHFDGLTAVKAFLYAFGHMILGFYIRNHTLMEIGRNAMSSVIP